MNSGRRELKTSETASLNRESGEKTPPASLTAMTAVPRKRKKLMKHLLVIVEVTLFLIATKSIGRTQYLGQLSVSPHGANSTSNQFGQ